MERLLDKVAIVTGSGRGIGKAVARHYVREGASVVIAEIDTAQGKKLESELIATGGSAAFIKSDLNKLSDIDALMTSVQDRFGRLDILVNNAAVTKSLDFFEVSERDWDWIHNLNTKGLFFCMQAAARIMKGQGGGKIVNIASIAGKGYPATSNVAYAGSKGAAIAMTRIGAASLARYNINVNAICPGVTRTDLYYEVVRGRVQSSGKSEQDIIAALDASIPIRRANGPEDIADLAVFLASDESRNVTGQSWNVDGGLMWD